MSSPAGFTEYLSTLPFLGRATLSHAIVEAGEIAELQATYEVGAGGLADGAWLKLVFKFYSDWGAFQTTDPKAANYLTAEYLPRPTFPGESPATVRELKLRFDQKGHERPFQKAIIVDVVDGYLKPGDKILLRLGDRRFGGPGTRVQTFTEAAFRFRVFVDNVGASRFAPVPGDMPLRIVAGPAVRGVLLAPRLAQLDVPLPIVLRFEDRWGNHAAPPKDRPILDVVDARDGKSLQSVSTEWLGGDAGVAKWTLALPYEGTFRLTALGAEALVTVSATAPAPRAYYADLHIHSEDTVGINTTRDVMTFARDAAALDIAGYTANDFNVRADRWHEAVAVCRALHKEREFLCFPGTEWCGASAVGGDRNVIFLGDEVRFPLDAKGRSLRVFDWNEDTAVGKTLQADVATAAGLHDAYRDLAAGDRVLLIPHVGGRRANFDWHDSDLERLVEVASSWGHFDWFYREALGKGLRVGASAAGDEHRGRPGGGAPGVGSFGTAGGLTGVLLQDLTAKATAAALRARHTWATTGTRAVALLSAGPAQQGDVIEPTGALRVHYGLYAAKGWEHIELRDGLHGETLLERRLDDELGLSPGRVRLRWGGARIRDRYRWAEWRLSLSINGSRVVNWTAGGLEHPEETVKQVAPGRFEARTDTYGDADSLEVTLDSLEKAEFDVRFEIDAYNKTGSALSRNPDKVVPGGHWKLSGMELLDTSVQTLALGGTELVIAWERLTDKPLPSEVSGDFVIEPAKASRSLYVFARERDDSKVWTSPIFVDFKAAPI